MVAAIRPTKNSDDSSLSSGVPKKSFIRKTLQRRRRLTSRSLQSLTGSFSVQANNRSWSFRASMECPSRSSELPEGSLRSSEDDHRVPTSGLPSPFKHSGILVRSTGVERHLWKGSTKLFNTWKTIGPTLPDIRRCPSGSHQSLAGHIQASISSSETDGLPSCSLQAAQEAWPVHSKSLFERSRHPKIPIPFQQDPDHDPTKPR
jgi:hypothetical protein